MFAQPEALFADPQQISVTGSETSSSAFKALMPHIDYACVDEAHLVLTWYEKVGAVSGVGGEGRLGSV